MDDNINTTNTTLTLGQSTTSLRRLLDPNEALACSREYPECEAARILWIILSPSVLVVGTVGNFLVLAIMMSRGLRKTAFGLYLAAISVNDTIAIWTGLARHFIKNTFLYDIRNYSSYSCQFQKFFLYGSLNTSVWLLAAVTIERTLSIYAPTRSSVFKSVNRTFGVMIAIAIAQYGWATQIFFTTGDKMVTGPDGVSRIQTCASRNLGSEIYLEYYHTYIAMFDYSILPFVIMLALNIAIIMKLRRRDRQYRDCATVNPRHDIHRAGKGKQDHSASQSKVSQKTLMLLPVTIFFLAATLPSLIFTSIEQTIKTEHEVRAKMELADFFFGSLLYFNHSMNFFLYCLSGKMFRKKCKDYLKRNCFCYIYKNNQKINKETRYWDSNHRLNDTTIINKRQCLYPRAERRLSIPSLRAPQVFQTNNAKSDSTVQSSVNT